MLNENFPPTFPTETGEQHGVIFVKAGVEYRLMRYDDDTWLIHRRNTSDKAFQIILTPAGKRWDVEGRNAIGPVMATEATTGELFEKLF